MKKCVFLLLLTMLSCKSIKNTQDMGEDPKQYDEPITNSK